MISAHDDMVIFDITSYLERHFSLPGVPGSQQPQAHLQALSMQLLHRHSAALRADGQWTVFLQRSWELLHKSPQEALGLLLLHPADSNCRELSLNSRSGVTGDEWRLGRPQISLRFTHSRHLVTPLRNTLTKHSTLWHSYMFPDVLPPYVWLVQKYDILHYNYKQLKPLLNVSWFSTNNNHVFQSFDLVWVLSSWSY